MAHEGEGTRASPATTGADGPTTLVEGRASRPSTAPSRTGESALSELGTVGLGGDPLGESLPRGTSVGRYVVLDELGRGGMGVVYRAFDPVLGRPVALKLIAAEREGRALESRNRDRLLREAQALARLSHPNVVTVYDVGSFATSVFVAMELVAGTNLRRWLALEPRSPEAVLAAYLAAGEGLGAAHAAGIVHRDFKPDNVIVGDDGRVRVLDFGLARTATEPGAAALLTSSMDGNDPSLPASSVDLTMSAATASASASPSQERAPSVLEATLTRDGALLGTPPYMSPEQLAGEPTDARSDQYSFCASLYEGLYGRRPFHDLSPRQRKKMVLAGRLPERPAGTKVPLRLHRALLRGLARSPSDRYASMAELLAALRRNPARQVRRWAPLAMGAVAVVAAAGYVARARSPLVLCQGAERKLVGVWDAGRRANAERAFHATGVPYAADTFRGVSRSLDEYATRWLRGHDAACEARVRGEVSGELVDRRMACLERRLDALRAQADVFVAADTQSVEKAVASAAALPPVETCSDAETLRAAVPLPPDAESRAQLEGLSRALARVEALRNAGRPKDALDDARRAAEGAQVVGDAPREAEALLALGRTLRDLGSYDEAAATLQRAGRKALAAHQDDVLAQAWTALVWVRGQGQSRFDEAMSLAEDAAAAVERVPSHEALALELSSVRATVAFNAGRYAEAVRFGERVLEAYDRAPRSAGPSPNPFLLVEALATVANARATLGELDAALALYERIRSFLGPEMGKSHPRMASLSNNVANVMMMKHQLGRALEGFSEALESWKQSLGEDHPNVATGHLNVGAVLGQLHRVDEALEHYRIARDIYARRLGEEHPDVALTELSIGELLVAEGRAADALAPLARSLATFERVPHPEIAAVLAALGSAHVALGHPELALPLYERAVAERERALGPRHALVADALRGLAEAHLARGRPALAVSPLSRAMSILAQADDDPARRVRTQFALARALWESGGERPRARSLAQDALALAKRSEGLEGELPARLEAWLGAHGAP